MKIIILNFLVRWIKDHLKRTKLLNLF